MSKRDTTAGLKDIREAIERIQRYVGTLGLDDFLTNTEKQDAVVRNFEIDSGSAATETLLFAIRVSRFGFVRQVRVHNRIAHSVLRGGVDDRAL